MDGIRTCRPLYLQRQFNSGWAQAGLWAHRTPIVVFAICCRKHTMTRFRKIANEPLRLHQFARLVQAPHQLCWWQWPVLDLFRAADQPRGRQAIAR
jgi:hypothetical protein